MNRDEFAAYDKRVATKADLLWEAAGRPDGPRDSYTDEARAFLAMEENPDAGKIDPHKDPVAEEAALMENLGEFASLSDSQAEEPGFPDRQSEKPSEK